MEPNQINTPPPAETPTVPDFSRPDIPVYPTPGGYQMVTAKKKYKYLKTLLVVLLCELLIGGGVAAFFWRDQQALKTQSEMQTQIDELQFQIDELDSAMTDETVSPTDDEVLPE